MTDPRSERICASPNYGNNILDKLDLKSVLKDPSANIEYNSDMRRLGFGVSILFLIGSFGIGFRLAAQPPKSDAREVVKLSPKEEKESYAVYATILRTLRHPPEVVEAWQIIQRTAPHEYCRTVKGGYGPIYQPVLDDYAVRNKKEILLERKFDLPSYELVTESRRSDRVAFTAIGFNRELTRAAVCATIGRSGTCYMLVKSPAGTWEHDKDYRGDGCAWAGD